MSGGQESAFARAAKVTKEKRTRSKRWLPYVISAIGALMVMMILKGNHHQEEKKHAETKQQKVEMAAVLIKQQLDALKKSETGSASASTNNTAQAYSKELIARMNAPTSMYESGGENAATAALKVEKGEIKEATFIGKGADQEFGNEGYETTSVNAKQVALPDYTIVSGEMIHATLNVAMNSDLPGMVTAMVTTPGYSYTGANELVPKGSRLIGQYSSAVLQGQSRIFIMWNRLVLPDGVSVAINSPDTDQIGQAGEPADYIHRHFWSRFGESVMLSILSAGVSNVDVQGGDQYNSAQAYRMAVAESLQSSAAGTLQQTLVTKPTLVRYQGANINVFIAQDLSFYDLYQQQGRV